MALEVAAHLLLHAPRMDFLKRACPARVTAWCALGASFVALYGEALMALVRDWANDDNYSHGFLIVPLAGYFVWERRGRLAGLQRSPSWSGLAVVAVSLVVFAAGQIGAERFLARVSLLGVCAGSVLFLLGPRHLRVLALPIAFLLLMIPVPAIVFNQIAFPLQILASQLGEAALSGVGVPVLREGNVIVLASTTLEVAEACSGIRSLVSLLTLSIVYGHFIEPHRLTRWLLVVATVPIAIVANGIRVAGTGIAAHAYGPAAADGFFHTFSGWVVFVSALAMLLALHNVVHLIGTTAARNHAAAVALEKGV